MKLNIELSRSWNFGDDITDDLINEITECIGNSFNKETLLYCNGKPESHCDADLVVRYICTLLDRWVKINNLIINKEPTVSFGDFLRDHEAVCRIDLGKPFRSIFGQVTSKLTLPDFINLHAEILKVVDPDFVPVDPPIRELTEEEAIAMEEEFENKSSK